MRVSQSSEGLKKNLSQRNLRSNVPVKSPYLRGDNSFDHSRSMQSRRPKSSQMSYKQRTSINDSSRFHSLRLHHKLRGQSQPVRRSTITSAIKGSTLRRMPSERSHGGRFRNQVDETLLSGEAGASKNTKFRLMTLEHKFSQ